MDVAYKRRFEELERCLKRIGGLYNGVIIIGNGEDSFQSPKDYFLNFLRVSYELKENLKNIEGFGGYNGLIEEFYNSTPIMSLSLDINNLKKHGDNRKPTRTKHSIGVINTGLNFFSPDGKNGTILTIEIDGQKRDVLDLCTQIFNNWDSFIQSHNL